MEINITTSVPQEITASEADTIVKTYVGRLRTDLSEPIGGWPVPFRVTPDCTLPETVRMTDGIYTDTKKILEGQGITVEAPEEYVRIIDPEVRRVLAEKMGSEYITGEQAKAVTSMVGWFNGNTEIIDFDCFENFGFFPGSGSAGSFTGCSGLQTIRLPEISGSLKATPSSAFQNCTSLRRIYLGGATITSNSAFSGCTALEEVRIRDIETFAKLRNLGGSSSGTIDSAGYYGMPQYVSKKARLIIDSTDEVVRVFQFPYFDSQGYLNRYHFAYFHDLEQIIVDPGYQKIRIQFAYTCYDLVKVSLPGTVTGIEDSAFEGCPKLETIEGLDNVVTLGVSVFGNCPKLVLPEASELLARIDDGIIPRALFGGCPKIGISKIPDNITTIGYAAFSNNTTLTEVDLNNVTTLVAGTGVAWNTLGAFGGCTGLTSVRSPKLTSIGARSFYGCTSLRDLNLSEVTSIGDYAFNGCSSLQLTELPETLTSIGKYAFNGSTIDRLSCKIPDGVTSLPEYSFNCKAEYIHFNKVATTSGNYPMNINGICVVPKVYSTGSTEIFRYLITSPNVFILETGATISVNQIRKIGTYTAANRLLYDIPVTFTGTLSTEAISIKYIICRQPTHFSTINHCGTYIFLDSEDSTLATEKKRLIGSPEWVEAMQDLNTQYSGKWFNRCTEVTSEGYVSSFDGQYYPWMNQWADYDIFGVDRPTV